MFSKNNITTN